MGGAKCFCSRCEREERERAEAGGEATFLDCDRDALEIRRFLNSVGALLGKGGLIDLGEPVEEQERQEMYLLSLLWGIVKEGGKLDSLGLKNAGAKTGIW